MAILRPVHHTRGTGADKVVERSTTYDLDAGIAIIIDGVGAKPVVVNLDPADIAETRAHEARRTLLEELPLTIEDLALESAENIGALFKDSLVARHVMESLKTAGLISQSDIEAAAAAADAYVEALKVDKAQRRQRLAERQGKT